MTIKFQVIYCHIQDDDDQVLGIYITFKIMTIKFQVVYHHIQDDDDQVPGYLPSHSRL